MPTITNLCGNAHPRNFPCRECEYLRAKKAKQDAETTERLGEKSAEREPDGISEDGVEPSREWVSPRLDRSDDVPPPPKKARIEVAKQALSRAEISRRQREKDPDGYKKANRERMARKRRERGG